MTIVVTARDSTCKVTVFACHDVELISDSYDFNCVYSSNATLHELYFIFPFAFEQKESFSFYLVFLIPYTVRNIIPPHL